MNFNNMDCHNLLPKIILRYHILQLIILYIFYSMKQIIITALPLFCLLVYIMPGVISTPSLGKVDKHDWNKVTYTKKRSDSIENSEKSAISPHHCEDNKVNRYI